MSETLVIWLFAGLFILTVLIVIWQALEAYQVRKIKSLIRFAIQEFSRTVEFQKMIATGRDKNGKFVGKK